MKMVVCSFFIINFCYIFSNANGIEKTRHLLTKISTFVNSITRSSRKQQKAEAAAFGSRKLKLQTTDGLFESTNFEKVKGSNIVKCAQKKYFSYNR